MAAKNRIIFWWLITGNASLIYRVFVQWKNYIFTYFWLNSYFYCIWSPHFLVKFCLLIQSNGYALTYTFYKTIYDIKYNNNIFMKFWSKNKTKWTNITIYRFPTKTLITFDKFSIKCFDFSIQCLNKILSHFWIIAWGQCTHIILFKNDELTKFKKCDKINFDSAVGTVPARPIWRIFAKMINFA